MRIAVYDTAAKKGGALSVLKDFYGYLRNNEKEHEWIFLLSSDILKEAGNIKIRVLDDLKQSRLNRLKFDLYEGKRFVDDLKPDVFFSMQNTLVRGLNCKKVLYVHQPLCFQDVKDFSLFKKDEREYAVYQHVISKMIYSSIRQSDRTIVQTQWMKDALVRKTGVNNDRVVRILPDTADVIKYREEVCPDPSLFFYPASDILYKNHELILKASRILKGKGITDFKVYFTLTKEEFARRFPGYEASEAVCLGPLRREEVLGNYNRMVLLFPSYIETFGYPLMEARQMGTCILSSDLDYSREVLSGYDRAFYFDPFDPETLAELMEKSIRGQLKGKDASDGSGTVPDVLKESSWSLVVKELTQWQ
ncbi:MAG: glycosyltransferase [Lachnospiraceae bacterium]|nr:glycosyltransferase [Lachnospiraceae bacterium]